MSSSDDSGAKGSRGHPGRREPAAPTTVMITVVITGLAIAYEISLSVRYDAVPLARGSVSDKVADVLMFALMSAFLAFGTLELIKRLTPLRGKLQSRWVMSWFKSGVGVKQKWEAFDELVSLTGERALSLPIEQFTAVASTAVDLALARRDHESSTLLDALGFASGSPPKQGGMPTGKEGDAATDRQEDLMALSVSLRIGLDQLQIAVGERWRRFVQSTAVCLASAYGFALSFAFTSTAREQPRYILAASVLGGPLAWLVRDLTAMVERARR
jgi:hypothetical protein